MDRNLFGNVENQDLVKIIDDLVLYSERGNVDLALGRLTDFKQYAEDSGVDIKTEDFERCEREIYNDTVELSLNYAKIYLTMECKALGKAWLDEAKKYADKIKLDIETRMKDIEEIFGN